ncbi:hypothetical protein MUBE_07735 [Mycobacterium uberis]|uniref:Uncharacterized protein n=1 Tax=Mycobacterium uberis TaxID=2162698 RepID=A0A3E1HHA8_9MYCO|nr:hypothetical protein MUBE_07735 [Mycobacterium uberis]
MLATMSPIDAFEQASHPLITVVDALLNEPRPAPFEPYQVPDGSFPLAHATTGLYLAANAIAEADYARAVLDWQKRQQILQRWRKRLQSHPVSHTRLVAMEMTRDTRPTLKKRCGLDTDQYETMLTTLELIFRWPQLRDAERARKHRSLADRFFSVSTIFRRCEQRTHEILQHAKIRIEALDPSDHAGRNQIIASAHRDLETTSETAIGRINTQTRRILDLDESTAGISVKQWLHDHGLVIST